MNVTARLRDPTPPTRKDVGAPASPESPRRRAAALAGVVLAVAAGYLAPEVLGGGNLVYSTFVLIAIFSVMSYGVDLILSYLGEVSLGHTLFWAGGAYTAAMLATRAGWPPLATLVAAVGVALLSAFALGLLTLRTREFVFSLVTYAATVIAVTVVSNLRVLGGSDGIVAIPLLELPAIGGTYTAATHAQLWPIAFGLLVATIYFVARFRRSRLGATALMVQMNPDLARTLGVGVRTVRLAVFTVSAPITAVAGWLYAYQRSYVSPGLFDAYFLIVMLTAVILAGRRVLLGPIVGTALIVVQQQFASLGGDGNKIVLGLILGVVLLVWPDGLAGVVHAVGRRLPWRAAAAPGHERRETEGTA